MLNKLMILSFVILLSFFFVVGCSNPISINSEADIEIEIEQINIEFDDSVIKNNDKSLSQGNVLVTRQDAQEVIYRNIALY